MSEEVKLTLVAAITMARLLYDGGRALFISEIEIEAEEPAVA